MLEFGLHAQPFAHGTVHAGVEKLDASLACCLGAVHGGIRVAQHRRRGLRRVVERYPDAGTHGDLDVGDPDRLGDRVADPLGGEVGRRGAAHVLEEDGELVTAEARTGVLGPDRRSQPRPDQRKELVAGAVAEAVVHGLEVVEVDEEDAHLFAGSPFAGERVREPVEQQRSIGEACQFVVEGLMGELFLQLLACRDVMGGEHDAVDVVVLDQVAEDGVQDADASVTPERTELVPAPAASSVSHTGEQTEHRRVVIRVYERDEWRPDELRHLIAEHALDRRRVVADRPIGFEHDDHVGRVLYERPEALGALPLEQSRGQGGAFESEADLRAERLQCLHRRAFQ